MGRPADIAPPEEYVRFTQRRRIWQELGEHLDDMEHGSLMETLTFFRLEDKYCERDAKQEKS